MFTEPTPRINFRLATPEIDDKIRAFLEQHPSDGSIKIALERGTSYLQGQEIEGSPSLTVVAMNSQNEEIAALGSLSYRSVYLDGAPAEISYLGGLRIDPRYRSGTVLARGYRKIRELHESRPAQVMLTTIVEDNFAARKLLTSGRAGLPAYRDLGAYVTLVFDRSRCARGTTKGLVITTLDEGSRPEWLAFLACEGRKRQFFPADLPTRIDPETERGRGLAPGSVYIARRGSRIVGTLSLWNQHPYRQWRVHGYGAPLLWLRHPVNLVARWRGIPRLPAPGEPLSYQFLSLVCVENDDETIFTSLLRTAASFGSGGDMLVAGFHESDPLLPFARKTPSFAFRSRLYFVEWEPTPNSWDNPKLIRISSQELYERFVASSRH